MYWIAHHRGKFRLYINTSTQTTNKIVITDFFAQCYTMIFLNRNCSELNDASTEYCDKCFGSNPKDPFTIWAHPLLNMEMLNSNIYRLVIDIYETKHSLSFELLIFFWGVFLYWASLFNFLNYFVWLRINDEGSVPEMRKWSILLIKSDIKWCIRQSRSLFLYLYNVINML